MIFLFLQFVAATILNVILAATILAKIPRRQPGRLFGWFVFGIAAWTACGGAIEFPGAGRDTALFFIRANYFCATSFAICWLWFCDDFPYRLPAFRRVAWTMTILGLPWLVVCWGPWLMRAIDGYPWGEHGVVGTLHPIFSIWITGCALASGAHLVLKARRSRGIARVQIRFILYGFVAMMIAGIAVDLVLPWLTHSSHYAQYGPLSSLFVTVMATLAIIRYRLMDIKIALRVGLAYSLTIGVLTGLYALLIPITVRVFTRQFEFTASSASFFLALIAVVVFNPLRHRIQGFIDRRFFKSVYDYRQTLRAAGEALASARDSDTLVTTLTEILTTTLQPREIAVYLPNSTGMLTLDRVTGPWDLLPGFLPETDPLLLHAIQQDDILLVDTLLSFHSGYEEVGLRMKAWGVAVTMPLMAGKQICGLVLLGEKRCGDIYSGDDASLLRILSKQAALALDNAYHYEALRRANTQLEQRVQERTCQLGAANQQLEAANAALEAERASLSAAVDILPLPMLFLDKDGTIIRKNRALTELFAAHSSEEFPETILLDPDSRTRIPTERIPSRRALRGEVTTACEKILVMPDGVNIPVLAHAGPVTVGDELVSAVVAFQDITALKAADRAKDEFLAMLSHELKTPLTCIIAWAEVASYETDPTVIAKAVDIIRQSAVRQRHLLNDLLDVSRIIHNKMLLHPVPADLWAIAVQSVTDLEQVALEFRLTVTLQPPAEPLPVFADPSRMAQVIYNLLNNSFKFTDPGGCVTMTGWCEGTQAVIEISDNGRGIPPELLCDLFAPFRQVERIEPSGGLGLGLALVKGITELHQGAVTANSAGFGHGSTFRITLPIAVDAPATDAPTGPPQTATAGASAVYP